ncbi:DNA mismatch repair protein MutS [Flavihumibacter sp. R14]|nr:DNA mismatch repair protein MutS [Flavihumibacter soli]
MSEALKYYHEQIGLAEQQVKRAARMINTYSFLRLGAIVLGFLLLYQSLRFELVWLTELVFFLVVIIFGWLVSRQSSHEKERQFFENLRAVNENEIASIGSYKNMYHDGSDWQDDHHVYTADLDIFGRGSLFHLVNRCSTMIGNAKLADWLLHPSETPIIRLRQEGIREISLKAEWKAQFQARLLPENTRSDDHISRLTHYLSAGTPPISAALKYYVQIAGWIFIALVISSLMVPQVWIAVIVLAVVNLFIIQKTSNLTERSEQLIFKAGITLSSFADSFRLIENEKWQSVLCREYGDRLNQGSKSGISAQIKQLSTLVNRMNLGSVPLIGFILKVSMLWNLRQYFAIEAWKQKNGHHIEAAFVVVADFEALLSLAGLLINHPEYHFPKIADDQHYTLAATDIGHPLIPVSTRVLNDYSLQNELKIDVITGSNMAGKSTFLRTLGINTVLALSGAPVCAASMRLCPMMVFSYMRIRDSLNENTSTFKAELDRLALLLQVLKKEEKVYFLIDEMLRGTNSVDKYRGSKAVIEKLIAEKGVGIVATHDLQIAHLANEYPDYIRNFYFDIRVQGQQMQFDYKLKRGECTTFNATLLLKQLGIEIPD